MKEVRKNVAASVHARLLAGAHARKEEFTLTLQRYTAERFLYRLGASRHREQFVLKGAMLFALWGGSLYRATRDLDLTGYTEDDSGALIASMQEICAVACPGDGLTFQAATVRAEPIRDKSEYHGFRVKLQALLGAARLPLQIDVGFGNAIEPPAREEDYPVLLDGPAPRIRAYPPEAVIAEKLHAHGRPRRGQQPLQGLLRHPCAGNALLVLGSVAQAGHCRHVCVPAHGAPGSPPLGLAPAFYADAKRAAEWQRYLSRNTLPGAPADFATVGELLQAFLGPVWSALALSEPFERTWQKGGPWEATP